MAMFLTCLDARRAQPDDASLVIFLGTAQDKAVSRKHRLWFPTVTEAAYQAVCDLNPVLLANGVTLVIGRDAYRRAPRWVDRIQKRLAWQYLKYVHLPRTSPSVPDPLNLRSTEGSPMLLYRELAQARNHPLHLRWPLCSSLLEQTIQAPVAWLLPSPSLRQAASVLEELQRTCLIGCISLSLDFCLEHGIEPDFVLQLDTDFRYPHVLRPGRRLPNTWLVSLSGANISDAALDYGGVFFMESFSTAFFPDPWRLRESWTGSAIACLGLAECLGAPDVFVAGMDHSWPGASDAQRYYNAASAAPAQSDVLEGPPLVVSHRSGLHSQDTNAVFPLADMNGDMVWSRFNYFGIAAELEDTAREIGHASGVRFHRLSNTGILDPEVFRPDGTVALSQLPDLDREGLRTRIAQAARKRPVVRTGAFADALAARLSVAEEAAALARQAETQRILPPELAGLADSLRQTGELGRYFYLNDGVLLSGLADVLRAWTDDLARALGLVRALAALAAGEALPVLTLAEEVTPLLATLNALHPRGAFLPHILSIPYKGPDDNGIYGLYGLLAHVGLVVASPGVEREFDYVLRAVSPRRVIPAHLLL